MLTDIAPEPHQDEAIQVEVTLPVRQRRGEGGKTPNHQSRGTSSRPRIPRITRLMALAIKFQVMVDRGEVDDYADLARLGYVTRARITQIMNLLNLAPDLQEQILFAGGGPGLDGVPFERQLRPALTHKSHSFMHHRNLLYTAVTRAQKSVIMLGDHWGIENCAKKQQVDKRNTFLSFLLHDARSLE